MKVNCMTADDSKDMSSQVRFATLAVKAGQCCDGTTNAVVPAISLSTTFQVEEPGNLCGYEYARGGNPNREQLETAVAALEGTTHAVSFSSGSAGSSAVVMLMTPGAQIVCAHDVFGGTNVLFSETYSKLGFKVVFVDMKKEHKRLVELLEMPETKMLWMESTSNPLINVLDTRAIVSTVRKCSGDRVLVVVDNTFMTPYLTRPLEQGVDIVVHSASKYLCGHSDAMIGVVACSSPVVAKQLKKIQNQVGGIPGMLECYLTRRGIKTLPLRMRQHSESAMRLAQVLQAHDKVEAVFYPGLEQHDGHAILAGETGGRGFGGMMSFVLKPATTTTTTTTTDADADVDVEKNRTIAFLRQLKMFVTAPSLGGAESLVAVPCAMSHRDVCPHQCKRMGINWRLVRLSVGLEDVRDLESDLQQALGLLN